MKKILFAFSALFVLIDLSAQNDNSPFFVSATDPADTAIYLTVDVPPSFPGGEDSLLIYLRKNVVMPEQDVYGTVFVEIVIEKNGTITHPKVLRGIGGGCDEEAVRVVLAMPAWIPAKTNELTVRSRFIVPVPFKVLTEN